MPSPTLTNKQLDLRSALKQFEQRLIDDALRLADGNKALAARMLKLKRTTLVAKLRGRGLEGETHDSSYPFTHRAAGTHVPSVSHRR